MHFCRLFHCFRHAQNISMSGRFLPRAHAIADQAQAHILTDDNEDLPDPLGAVTAAEPERSC